MRTLMLASLLLLAGCGGNDGKTITVKDGDRNVVINADSDDGVTTIRTTGDDGEKLVATINGEGAAWPADAAPYATAFPGAKVTAVMASNAGEKGSASVVTFESGDAPDKVIAYYKALAAKAGLKENMTMNSGGSSMFTATDGTKGNAFIVQASTSDGKTVGSVTIGKDG